VLVVVCVLEVFLVVLDSRRKELRGFEPEVVGGFVVAVLLLVLVVLKRLKKNFKYNFF
jgi:hypothetical protein